ncbi:MAG: S46 family peptidase [Bacteroidia bacterium]|nr:S46 family peptidase [Bacteroidia bacterium]
MKKKLIGLLMILGIGFGQQVRADEGMWPLFLISQLQDSMQARGLQLSAEDIYSINKACIKDAVVRLMSKQNRMFCTGEIISQQGLFLTNHHCGYGAIQELSTNEDNILTNGFWAKNQAEERPANFNIGLLAKVEDVTSMIMDSLPSGDDEAARAKAVAAMVKSVSAKLKEALGADKEMYVIEVVPFWAGNKYLAMYYQVFQDIRLVGTPPENIGKFGGETDNWMWPRHTCDISIFRIYADASNNPAKYSKDNKPYAPKYYFPINIQGPQEKSYAMILGYPGRTQRYTFSDGIKYYSDKERPKRVKVRRDILDIYEEYMHKDPKIKLMYADKFAGLSNYWKKFMGEADALKKLNIYERRKDEENKFSAWVKANNKTKYSEVISTYSEAYAKVDKIGLYGVYLQDGISNSQPMVFAMGMGKLEELLKDKSKKEEAKKEAAAMAADLDADFKEYYEPIEKKVLASVLMHLVEDLDNSALPASLIEMANKHKKNYTAMAEEMWKKSIFVSKEKFSRFLNSPSLKTLQKDPIYKVTNGYITEITGKMQPEMNKINSQLGKANRLFQAGVMEMSPNRLLTPDANGTMRMTYGRVLPYNGKDATFFKEFTTSRGVIEKYAPGDIEFDAPARLIDMMKKKDFGQYADKDGELHACFLTDNDITGGNSGSPVINGKGELIGTAFDGNWEAIASDFAFEPQFQRTICVDIRYTLFILDKFGGAGHLLNEMKIIR